VDASDVLSESICDIHMFRRLSVMGYRVTVPECMVGRDSVCYRSSNSAKSFGRVLCMFASTDRQIMFALSPFKPVRPNNVPMDLCPFFLCEERVHSDRNAAQLLGMVFVPIDDVICPVSLLLAPKQLQPSEGGGRVWIVVSSHVSVDLP
jgi:hypothetical protein